MIKKWFVQVVLCLGCTVLLYGREYTLKITNNTASAINNFPVVFKLSALDGAIPADSGKVQIFDADGREVPSQLDDLDLNGCADKTDEAAMLAKLKPGENIFKIKLLPGKFPSPQSAGKRSLYLAAENGIIRVEQSKSKLQQRIISRFNNGKYERIAGHFVQELNMDKSWKWFVRPEVSAVLVSSGTVRQIVRFNSVVENRDSGKQAKLINDMHIFNGRSEVLCRFLLTNISKGQLLQVFRINQGFYETGINGKVIPAEDRFSGIGSKGETLSGTLVSGSFTYRNRSSKAPVRMNFFRPDAGGIGLVADDPAHFDSCCTVYLPQRKTVRFSWLHCPANLVLWPGRSLDLQVYLVLHGGKADAAEEFAKMVKNVSLEFLPGAK